MNISGSLMMSKNRLQLGDTLSVIGIPTSSVAIIYAGGQPPFKSSSSDCHRNDIIVYMFQKLDEYDVSDI